jgi:AhpD family alkylhydroperoxidase
MFTDHAGSHAHTVFTDHTVESAPTASRRVMTATERHLGYLPAASARMAESPHLLDGVMTLIAAFDGCTLDPLAREVLVMTIATGNGCHVCIAIHTARLAALDADPALVAALRAGPGEPLADPRLQAIRAFTLRVLETAGDAGGDALGEFLAHGYTPRNALEVVLGIGTYTMTTLANRLTQAPVDEQVAQFS